MDLPQPKGDVLTQPTRARIFALLVELRGAAGTDELAERLGLHPNGVRRHLERLHEAGLVERSQAHGERGRPRDSWRLSPDAHPGGERPKGYSDLATWLVRAITNGAGELDEVERTGRQIGRELAPEETDDPLGGFRQALTALGFQPELEPRKDGELLCRLENCPYRDAVRQSPDVVCALHRGVTAGLLAALDSKAELTRFEPHDPDRAGCLVEVSGGSWKRAPTSAARNGSQRDG